MREVIGEEVREDADENGPNRVVAMPTLEQIQRVGMVRGLGEMEWPPEPYWIRPPLPVPTVCDPVGKDHHAVQVRSSPAQLQPSGYSSWNE
jgi:hypothetical protein